MPVYERLKPGVLFLSLALIIMGIIFIAFPDSIASFLAAIVGTLIILYGLFRTVTALNNWPYLPNRIPLLIVGILIFLAGIVLLFNPDLTLSIAGSIIGIFAILAGVERFITANRLRPGINVRAIVLSGVIHLLFGLALIYSAVLVFSVIIILIGIYLLISGIMFLISTFYFRDF